MTMKGRQPMRSTSILLCLVAATALSGAACSSKGPSTLETSGGSNGSETGGDEVGSPSSPGGEGPMLTATDKATLAQRVVDYNEALRTASLKLVRALPTLAQIKHVKDAGDLDAQKVAYEEELDAMFEDTRFQERMIKWWKDVMRMGGAGGNGKPSRDTAPIFAARVMATEAPYADLFTATSNTCPTYDSDAHMFVDGDCNNGVPTHAGVLTNPGVMYQFSSAMAFRRVRWVQEIFVCTKFPAEYSETPVHMGSADYTSPWTFESIGNSPIDFQDTSSVICANCHTTINHIAPLFGNFDENGQLQGSIQVMTPTAPDPVQTELSHWLKAGEKTSWRKGEEAADLPALGEHIAADPDVAECAVARMWNFAMSKEDIVSDLATVPTDVLEKYITEFDSNGQNLKGILRSIMKGPDFVRF